MDHFPTPSSPLLPRAHPNHTRPKPLLSFLHPSYIIDYSTSIALIFFSLYLQSLEPFHQDFSVTDPSISHPARPQAFGRPASWAVALLTPTLAALLWNLGKFAYATWQSKRDRRQAIHLGPNSRGQRRRSLDHRSPLRNFLQELHFVLLASLTTVAYTQLLIYTIKMLIGRLRPDFLARCDWSVLKQACTGDPELIRTGRMSFPSGHSGRTAAGLGLVALYLAGKTKVAVFDGAWRHGGRVAAAVVCVGAPLCGAVYVAITRLQGNMHHPTDVIVGDLIGFSFAYIVYRFYFPSPFVDSAYTGLPKAEAEEDGVVFGLDDEAGMLGDG
ncbi:hypothetical protein HDV00_002989 [Rhizophlyctis rosea]|nr:hypothetical protein HDV00_002989 [Rhizophlyctis rosea]